MRLRAWYVLSVFSLLLLRAPRVDAQEGRQPQARSLPHPVQVCSMMASVVSINIVGIDGKPVSNATVRMTRLRDGKSLGNAVEMRAGSGEFQVVETTALNWIAPDGDRIRLVASAGGRSAKTIVRVGRDTSGCRLVKLAGPAILALK